MNLNSLGNREKIIGAICSIVAALIGYAGITNQIQGKKEEINAQMKGDEHAAAVERESARMVEVRERFSKAMTTINSDDVRSRKSAISDIEIAWKDIIKESPEKQWSIVTALSNSVTTYPKFSNNLDIKNKHQATQMALDILKSRNPKSDDIGKRENEASRIIGLIETNLSGYDLSNGQFPNASFNKSKLDNATLTGANLKGSYFIGSSLSGAILKNVDLSGANVKGTELAGADLSNANLSNSNLMKSSFHRTNLRNVDLTGSNITEQQIMQSCNWRLAKDDSGKIENLKQKYVYRKKSGCEKFE